MRTLVNGPRGRRDEGSALILVLVLILVSSFIVIPLIEYTITVNRTAKVEIDKARAVHLARGGFWVALSREADLYDDCNGGALPSSLSGVSTTCAVLSTTSLHPPDDVPFGIAVVQADTDGAGTPAVLPATLSTGADYTNPNTSTDWAAWLDSPDWTFDSSTGKVWLPQLPVQSMSGGGTRVTTMKPNTQDPAYGSCRVFFPGTFTTPITIAEPAYFTSGVYYFTEPITLATGADVVVGNGAALGCTTDFEAVASAELVPNPLNLTGLGGTFVLGGDARIVIDDAAGSGDIRFAMNQRYVSDDEASVAPSRSVSIMSVNGNHAPYDTSDASDVLESDLDVDGVLAVPRSRVDDPVDDPDDPADDPYAHDAGYEPSTLTPKPKEPDAPTNVTAAAYQFEPGSPPGRITVAWDVPNDNGSLITSYTATDVVTGLACSPPPADAGMPVQPTCTITGLSHQDVSQPSRVSVIATSAYGSSAPSEEVSARVNLVESPQSPSLALAEPPANVAFDMSFSDGFRVVWEESLDDGGTPISGYRATAYDHVGGAEAASCTARWDETACVLETADGVVDGGIYDVVVVALTAIGESAPSELDADPSDDPLDVTTPEPDPVLFVAGADESTPRPPEEPAIRVPNPILDLVMTSAAGIEIDIAGYIAVPQGHVRIDAPAPVAKRVALSGGLVAGQIRLGIEPAQFEVIFDNPVAQKTIRIRSTASTGYTAVADAVVQVNRSGSVAVNSLVIQ